MWHRVQISQSPDEAVHIGASDDERQTVGVAIRPGAQQQEGKYGDRGNRKASSGMQGHIVLRSLWPWCLQDTVGSAR